MSFFEPDAEDRPLVPASERARPLPEDTSLGALFAAGAERMGLISNTIGGELLRERAYDERIDAVFRATGVRLDNPARRYFTSAEAEAELAAAGRPVERAAWRNRDAAMALAAEQFDRRLAELAQERAEDPQAVAAIAAGRPIDEDVRALFNRATADEAAALGAGNINPVVKWGTYLAGGVVGGLRDPINLLGLFIGGPATGTARTIAGAVLRTGIREAVANAGVEALSQPFVAQWRADLGLPVPTLREAATDVGMAALFGGALGSAGEGARQAIRISFPAAARGTGGDGAPPVFPATDPPNAAPRPPETPETAIGRGLDGDDAALIDAVRAAGDAAPPEWRAAAEALEADWLIQERAADVAPPEVAEPILSSAMRRAEDPDAPAIDVPPPVDRATHFDRVVADLETLPGQKERNAGRSVAVARDLASREARLFNELRRTIGLDETASPRDPRWGQVGELANILARDLPAARSGQSIMGQPVDEIAVLEARRDDLVRLLRPAPTAGPFGPIHTGFEDSMGARWREARDLLLEKQDGEVPGAFWRDDIGAISLPWGKPETPDADGFGLAKIADKHPEVLDTLGDIVRDGHVIASHTNKLEVASPDGLAAIRLDWNRQAHQWLVTAFDPRARKGREADLRPGDTSAHPGEPAAAGRADGSSAPQEEGTLSSPPLDAKPAEPASVLDAYPLGAGDVAGDGARLVDRSVIEAEGSRLAELSAAVAACRLF